MGIRIGIDTGGTFTDLVALDEESGAARVMKVSTTPEDPARGVLAALERAAEAFAYQPTEVTMVVEGSTIAINTLVQRNGARVGLLVTRGFRDVLELRRLRLPRVNDLYVRRPAPLVPRACVRELAERLDAVGNVVEAPDIDGAIAAVGDLLENEDIDALAIAFLHSFRNPAHEQTVAAAIRNAYPGLFVSASSEVWPVRGEYERTVVAVVNAYVGRRMHSYVDKVERGSVRSGVGGPLLATKSNGGIMDASGAAERPVETLMSGPSAGVVAAYGTARAKGWSKALSFDMGGTTADVAIIDGGIPYSYESAAGDFAIVVPSVDVHSIGAGGGSIVYRDEADVLKVGPRSAGAVPGPVCYGLGGREPTVTDAYVALGMIPDGAVLGGWVTVDQASAIQALKTVHADPQAVLDVATATMAARLMPLAAAAGVDISDLKIIAYGGAGPTHGCLLAAALGISTVLIPPMPGAMCALGAVLADLRVDFVRTLSVPCDSRGVDQLQTTTQALRLDAENWLEQQHVGATSIHFNHTAEMRFHGQSFEIPVALDSPEEATPASLHTRFCERYRAVYGEAAETRPSEIVNVRLQLIGHVPSPTPHRVEDVETTASASRGDLPTYSRSALERGVPYRGTAIIVQYDTTIYLPNGSVTLLDDSGNLEISL